MLKKFNKVKEIKKLRKKMSYERNIKNNTLILSIVILMVGIMYFTFARFESSNSYVLVNGKVGDYSGDSSVIAIYVNNIKEDTIPSKDDDFEFEKAECTNGASATWDDEKWGLFTTLTSPTKCKLYFKDKPKTVARMMNLAKQNGANDLEYDGTSTLGTIGTSDDNLRYVGSSPSNYIYFNCSDYSNQNDSTCEKWRIIGLFNNIGIKVGETTGSLVKIIRDESLGSYSWNSSSNSINMGYGINQWGSSGYYQNAYLYMELKQYLNGGSNSKWYSGRNLAKDYDSPSSGLSKVSKNYLEDVVVKTGGVSTSKTKIINIYNEERGTKTGKDCTSSNYCNDSIDRTTEETWSMITLPYASDFIYSIGGGSSVSRITCLSKNVDDTLKVSECQASSWLLNYNSTAWTVSPNSSSQYAYFVMTINKNYLSASVVSDPNNVYPVMYLKENVIVTSGDGTKSNPYKLGIRE